MKTPPFGIQMIALSLLLTSCSTVPKSERGPDGTRAYYIEIESSEPAVRVEVNEDYVGKTPLKLKVFGDDDGTFHNFGSMDFIIRAFPNDTNYFVQTKVFRTGGWFSQEDQIPGKIYFDMNRKSGFTIDPPRY
jgi:hypothetical protein